jgi:hypothetical protein
MTPVPPPASPCVRVRLDYQQDTGNLGGSRFFLSYAGSAPTGANCTALADGIEAAWVANLQPLISNVWSLVEVDVLDIATEMGLSGQWTGTETGSRSGISLPSQCCTNVEYNIARRYRGGKPRMFLPPGVGNDQASPDQWSDTYIGEVNTGMAAFFAAIAALSIGAMGALAHVNLSYYKGFTNITNSSGRERAVPTYRDSALLDTVSGYSAKTVIGSQRRRRTATTY